MTTKHAIIIGGTGRLGREIGKLFECEGKVDYIGRNLNIPKNATPTSLIFCQRNRIREEDEWDNEMAATLTATRNVIEYYKDRFNPAHPNSIILVSSNAAVNEIDDQPLSYHVAKTGLLGICNFYSSRLFPITVNCVLPSVMHLEDGKFGRKDVAQLVKFLCGDDARYITNQKISIGDKNYKKD